MINTPRLFYKNEIGEAIHFLALESIRDNSFALMDVENEVIDDNKKIEIAEHIYTMTYGINAPLMANYLLVQNFFIEKYQDDILKYLNYSGHKSSIITIVPCSITAMVLGYRVKTGSIKLPLTYWDSNKEWNLHEVFEDSNKNLTNPINGFVKIILRIENVHSIDFIRNALANKDDIDRMTSMISSEGSATLNITILPRSEYTCVLNLIDNIYKYF